MLTLTNHSRTRRWLTTGSAATAAAMMLFTGPAFADSTTLSPGQTVDLYTFSWSSTADFQVSFQAANGVYAPNIPTVGGNQLTVTQTPLSNGGYSDKLEFTMPNLGITSQAMDTVITTGAGTVVARFQPVQPPITGGYGLPFTYDSTPVNVAPANNLPEVPFAGALPVALLGLVGGVWLDRARRAGASR